LNTFNDLVLSPEVNTREYLNFQLTT